MKVFFHILMSLIMLASSTGATIARHYCGDKLREVKINQETEGCCKKDDCCKHEKEKVIVDEPFFVQNVLQMQAPLFFLFQHILFYTQNPFLTDQEPLAYHPDVPISPPGSANIYLRIQSFLI